MEQHDDAFADLLARVRRGDEAALTRLVQDYEPKVRLAARALLGPALRRHLDTVDVAQSVHIALMAGLREDKYTLAGPDNLTALAVSLVRRKVALHWRRLQREQRRDAAMAASPPGDGGLGDDPARIAQFREEVRDFWHSLDATERALMELRMQGYTTADAAAELGLAANVLRVLLSRLRQRLRRQGHLAEWL